MTENQIALQLESLTIGKTTTINGHVVTRWAVDRFEVGTINRARCSTVEAIGVILT